ncbi:MAG: VWA domain-containing protein [Nitrospirae bacterium]|nr:VWA domain-containing protein [Nitrospirota bacterium]
MNAFTKKFACLLLTIAGLVILPTLAHCGSLYFVIDRSGSMAPYAGEIKAIALGIIERFPDAEVVLFNDKAETVESKQDLVKKLQFRGGTDYGQFFRQVGKNPPHALIFLTDGGDNVPSQGLHEGLTLRSKGVKQWCTLYIGAKRKVPALLTKISDKVIQNPGISAGVEECLVEIKARKGITDDYRNIDIENLSKKLSSY